MQRNLFKISSNRWKTHLCNVPGRYGNQFIRWMNAMRLFLFSVFPDCPISEQEHFFRHPWNAFRNCLTISLLQITAIRCCETMLFSVRYAAFQTLKRSILELKMRHVRRRKSVLFFPNRSSVSGSQMCKTVKSGILNQYMTVSRSIVLFGLNKVKP